MKRPVLYSRAARCLMVLLLFAAERVEVRAQSAAPRPKFDQFEVATIKPTDMNARRGRFITVQGTNQFVVKDYTLKLLISAAYSLNPQTISGGSAWLEDDHFDISAKTPGDVRPNHDEQMAMLRGLLADRFRLAFHRKEKVFSISIYMLEVAKGGPKLKETAASASDPVVVGPAVVFSDHVRLPGRNAAMSDFATLLQRAILDRPVVDKTGLSKRYDFDLTWAPDQSQFGGGLSAAPWDTPSPPLFSAIQEQLGLRLEATKGPVEALVVDKAEKPSAN